MPLLLMVWASAAWVRSVVLLQASLVPLLLLLLPAPPMVRPLLQEVRHSVVVFPEWTVFSELLQTALSPLITSRQAWAAAGVRFLPCRFCSSNLLSEL